MKKDEKNTKLIIIIASIAAVIVIVAIVIFVITSNKKKTEHIITSLGIDDYFKHVLTNDYEKNVNLLDVSKEDDIKMYYYYNKNTKIFKIDFQDPTFEGTLFHTYAKYNDYLKWHEKTFGVKSNHEMSMFDIDLQEVKHIGNDVYHYLGLAPIQCQYAENTDNCYLKLTKDLDNKGDVTVTNLKRKNNVITGTATFKSKTENFEFVYEEKDENYIIKTLKIVDIIE